MIKMIENYCYCDIIVVWSIENKPSFAQAQNEPQCSASNLCLIIIYIQK